jgi:hypothetical protein
MIEQNPTISGRFNITQGEESYQLRNSNSYLTEISPMCSVFLKS